MNTNMTLNQVVRESISLALIRLMGRKPFEEITVSEIAQAAGVSRSSFYRNYEDKAQVLRSYVQNLYRTSFATGQITPASETERDISTFLLPRFRFIREHGDLFTALSHSGQLYTIFEEMDPDLLRTLCGHGANVSDYHLAMSASACAGVVRQWINRDFCETPEEMAELFASLSK